MKVVVLAGGTSTERDVSLVTGTMVYNALIKNGHSCVLLDIYSGYTEDDYKDVFLLKKDWVNNLNNIILKLQNQDYKIPLMSLVGPNVIEICKEADIVFLALHGKNGEDGKIQAMFDLLNIKYTGTDYLSSAIAMDKTISKELLINNNIPMPKGITIKRGERVDWDVFPCIVKVSSGGSSIGVYKANNKVELDESLQKAFGFEEYVLIEEFIEGREFSIGIIDSKALPIIEIMPKVGFYNYKNKYEVGSAVEVCPANLPDNITKLMQKCAEKVYNKLRICSYARIDFRMDNNFNFYCLEANTLPGMTSTSLLPQEAKAIGIDFDRLCEKIIEVSMKKYK